MARGSDEWSFDLHLHTTYSPDGEMTPADLVRTAVAEGLKGIAVTDHNSMMGVSEARKVAEQFAGFVIIPGIEVSSSEGHILALGVANPIPAGLNARETIEQIRAAGGLTVASHPYRRFTGLGEDCIRLNKFEALEVLNGRSPSRKNLKACRLAMELGLGLSAGSDGHKISEVGRCFVLTDGDPGGIDGLLEMIRRRKVRTWGKSAGMIVIAKTLTKITGGFIRRRGKRI